MIRHATFRYLISWCALVTWYCMAPLSPCKGRLISSEWWWWWWWWWWRRSNET